MHYYIFYYYVLLDDYYTLLHKSLLRIITFSIITM